MKVLITLLFLTLSSFSFCSVELSNKFGVRYGAPSEVQILPIRTYEVFYQRELKPFKGSLLIPSLEFSTSKLLVADKHGVIWGIGLAYEIPLLNTKDMLSFVSSSKVHYMSRHDFGRKRYGGHIHFSYKLGVNLKITENLDFVYEWDHLSNADRYEYNPALETHKVSLVVAF